MKLYQRFLPYVVAIGSTGIALLLTLGLEPLVLRTIGAFFFIAIIVTAWYGGLRSGSVAVILSTVAINYWFIPPRHQFWLERFKDGFQLVIFLLVAFLINLLTFHFRDSKQKIERLSQQLAQENADQLRMALSAAQMGMWDWNIVTGEINWSPEHELLFGLEPDSFDGRYETFDACLHPEDRKKLNQALEQSLNNRIPYHHEFRVIWADGSIHWMEGWGQAFYDAAGQPIRMTGTVMAIDERQQAEAVLQEREAILRLFAQYAPAGIAMLDREMRYLMASQRWVDDHYLDSVESLIGRSHYEIFPEVPERWRQIYQRCLAGVIEKCDEDLFVRADGRQQWLSWEIHPWHTATGEIGGIIIFAIDVTNRKLTQDALQQSEQRYRALVHASSQIVWRTNASGSAIAAPQSWEELTGQSAAECLGWGWLNVVHPDDREHSAQRWQESYTNCSLYETEYRLRMKNGNYRNFAVRGVPILDADGKISEWIGTCTDITQQKLAEAALRENQILLERQLAEIETIYQSAPIGLSVLDTELRFVRINQRLAEINGLPVEAHIGCTVHEVVPNLADTAEQLLRSILETGEPVLDVEIIGETPAQPGVQRTWIESWLPLKDGETPDGTLRDRIIGINIVCEEITQRKKAEVERIHLLQQEQAARSQVEELLRQLAIERSRLEQVLQQMPVGVSIAEAPSGKLLFHNVEAERLLRHPLVNSETDEGYKHYSAVHLHGEPYNSQQYPLARALLHGEVVKAEEMVYRRGDGTTTLFAVSAAPILNQDGQVIAAVSTFEDIFERKQAEMALQQLNAELEQRVQERTAELSEVNDRLLEMLMEQQHTQVMLLEQAQLLDLAHDTIMTRDLNSVITFWNAGAEYMYGWKKVEALGQESHKFLQTQFPKPLAEIESELLERGYWEGELIHTRRDGSTVTVASRWVIQKDEMSRLVKVLEINNDISDRKRAEQMLELQAVITRNMAEGICLVRADNGVIVYANPKFEQMFGYDSGELNGQHVSIVNYAIEQVTAQEVNQAIRSAVLQSGEFTYEVHNVKKDGTPFWCTATTSVFRHPDYGDVLVAVHQDITDRKQTEEELRQSEAKFRSLSESSPVGIFMTDIQGQCIYTNPRYQAICGCTFDETLGVGWAQFIHPEEQEQFSAGWSKAVSQRQEFSGEISYVHKDGTIRFGRVRSAPIFSVSDELIGYVGTVEDITDSRAVETMKNEFISIVSHELRTPLTSIRGSLGLLAAGVFKNKPDSAQQMLDIAIHDTERLVRLVNDILDLERLDSHKVNLVKQWCDAATLLQQSAETVQSLAAASDITLCVESASLQIWVDSDRIIQTLVNLVSNAIKFSPPETTVTLSIQDQADQILFQVKDQGRGIPADKLDTIFGRFQQVDASDSRQKGGTGLGLAICKSIVQQHGGKIWVESVIGQGSSFYFTLPKLLD